MVFVRLIGRPARATLPLAKEISTELASSGLFIAVEVIGQPAAGVADQADLAGEIAAAVANGEVKTQLNMFGCAQFAIHCFRREPGSYLARHHSGLLRLPNHF